MHIVKTDSVLMSFELVVYPLRRASARTLRDHAMEDCPLEGEATFVSQGEFVASISRAIFQQGLGIKPGWILGVP